MARLLPALRPPKSDSYGHLAGASIWRRRLDTYFRSYVMYEMVWIEFFELFLPRPALLVQLFIFTCSSVSLFDMMLP